jgi:hypothetical protein
MGSLCVVSAQDDCSIDRAMLATELKGRVLFETNGELFSVRNAEVSVSEKGKEFFFGILDVKPDSDGYFTIKGLKPGKYYLSIDSMVGHISLLEFEIVGKTDSRVAETQSEFILYGLGRKCNVKTVKTFEKTAINGSTALSAWAGISEISLERTGCFGNCPIYKVTLRRDGTATYLGKRFSRRDGVFHGKLGYGFERLAEFLYQQGFFNLDENYSAPFTDLDTAIVTVVSDGKTKAVTDYGSAAPVELWGLEKLIDSISEEITWKQEKRGRE